MPVDHSLKRLGGGRWETRDGRFAIEPQSGTWVVVDADHMDELGLPLVRGPFATLTAAKAAIDDAREAGPVESPLAERLRQAREESARKPKEPKEPKEPKASHRSKAVAATRSAPEAPERPAEPAWILELAPGSRRRARDLIGRLEGLGITDAGAIAQTEMAGREPAIARLALELRLRKVLESAGTPVQAVRAAVEAILDGTDAELGVRWRLVDDRGRTIGELSLPG